MACPLPIGFPGALYHVTARGNARQDIFLDDDDRQRYLGGVLDRGLALLHLLQYDHCLMSNHFHLGEESPTTNLFKAVAAGYRR